MSFDGAHSWQFRLLEIQWHLDSLKRSLCLSPISVLSSFPVVILFFATGSETETDAAPVPHRDEILASTDELKSRDKRVDLKSAS